MTGRIERTLTKARALLDRPHGWRKNGFMKQSVGRDYPAYCAIGAIRAASRANVSLGNQRSIEAEAYMRERLHVVALSQWNDDATKAVVLAGFDRAIRAAKRDGA